MKTKLQTPKQSVDAFNNCFPVGSEVRVNSYGMIVNAKVEKVAKVIDDHTAVVKVSGLLERVSLLNVVE